MNIGNGLNTKKDAPDMQTGSSDENKAPTGRVYTGLRKNLFSLNRRTAATAEGAGDGE
jgi:hypothetical protein